MLEDSYELPEDAENLLQQSISAIDKAASLTAQLLAVSRRQILHPEIVDLSTTVTQLGTMLGRTLGAGIETRVTIDDDTWRVRIDPGQLESALINLAINARDAMEGQGLITINVRNEQVSGAQAEGLVDKAGDYVCVRILDTGKGMSPDVVSRIFEPFFTTKDTSKGTGLGLSMVHGFIKQSEGGIKVVSYPNKGTEFALYLPRSSELTTGNELLRPTEQKADSNGTQLHGQSKTILVIEDEPSLLKFVDRALRQNGYKVYTASGEEKAMEILSLHHPVDLVLSDIMLRGSKNGFDIASRIEEIYPDQQFLFMTGYADLTSIESGKEWSEIQLIKKPFGMTTLLDAVQSALRTSNTSVLH